MIIYLFESLARFLGRWGALGSFDFLEAPINFLALERGISRVRGAWGGSSWRCSCACALDVQLYGECMENHARTRMSCVSL